MSVPSHGMMLSEPPSAGMGGSVATDGGGLPLAGAGSIGNYKGVMLCNRPFAGIAAAAKGGEVGAAAGKQVFVTGKVKTEVGFAGNNAQKEKLLRKRVKVETALTRHRRWLADLQATKQALEEQYMEDLKKKEDNKRRFAEREARMRQMIRDLAKEGKGGEDSRAGGDCSSEDRGSHAWAVDLDDEGVSTQKRDSINYRPPETEQDKTRGNEGKNGEARSKQGGTRVDSAELHAVEKRRKRDGKPCRPMWAMTEAKAEVEDDLKHEQELKELLEFTQGLDFGKYIRDAEVQSMIDQVKKRITEIESRPEVDEEIDEDVEGGGQSNNSEDEVEARLEAKIMKLTDNNLRDMQKINGGDTAGGGSDHQEDDNISIARTALSEGGRSVRSIHSTRSLAAVAERARADIETARAAGNGTAPAKLDGARSGAGSDSKIEVAVNDIVVITHQDDGGLRLGGKNTVSNLPYIRRNPAL